MGHSGTVELDAAVVLSPLSQGCRQLLSCDAVPFACGTAHSF